ncbi:MAG: hypothetical protein M0Z54_12680 [Thermaerobacter sp.]|nr:hypothetical protein [Thermaerobacter sp.]
MAQDRIKAFCIDFNWDLLDRFASPGLYGHADAAAHVSWYRALGVNTIQSFFVSHNGYAWYDSSVAPRTPGMSGDFMCDLTQRGHEAGLRMMGYISPGANGQWAAAHPDLSHVPRWNTWHIPLTSTYLDYLARLLEDALRKVPVDGFMVDMLWNVNPQWMPCEQQMFSELMGDVAPEPHEADRLPVNVVDAFNRAATERAWRRIQEVARSVNPGCLIWLSVNNMMNAQLEHSRLAAEVDWLMNENPNMAEGLAVARRLAGRHAQLVQCVAGWEGAVHHDGPAILAALPADVGLYGFAAPDPVTTLPPDDGGINAQNIAALGRAFRGHP